MTREIKLAGKQYKIQKLPKGSSKEYVATSKSGKRIKFADPSMPEFPGTKRGDNYCARSFGIAEKFNTFGKPTPNTFSRALWSCRGKKSVSKKRFFGK